VDLVSLVDRGAYLKPFWDRNPRLQYVDSFPDTSFVIVKDSQTGQSGMLDTAVVINAKVQPANCDGKGTVPADATDAVCFEIAKPDTGAGVSYIGAVRVQVKAKDTDVARFYRKLFASRGDKVNPIKNSSWGIISEAEDQSGNTVARVSIRGSFAAARVFFAWTKDFH
jgi:hypothetical protein